MTSLTVVVEESKWLTPQKNLETYFAHVMCAAESVLVYGFKSVRLLLSHDHHMRLLNYQFRHKDKTTNVLAFPDILAGEGDIILSYHTIWQEAADSERDFYDHAAYLFVHALLHLIGYDHNEDCAQKIMTEKEVEILSVLGISHPHA